MYVKFSPEFENQMAVRKQNNESCLERKVEERAVGVALENTLVKYIISACPVKMISSHDTSLISRAKTLFPI